MFYQYFKRLTKNKIVFASSMYLFFSLITQCLNLLYTPLLTNNLTQEEYGIYSLFYSISGILSLLLLVCIPSGYSRFYNEVDNKIEYESTIFNFLTLFGILILIAIYIISEKIADIFFTGIINGGKYIFLIAISSYFNGLISLLTIKYSMEFKAFKASSIGFSQILIQYILILVLLEIGKFELMNLFYISLLVPLVLFILVFMLNIKKYRLVLKKYYLKNTLNYSSGLILGQISTWVLSLIDRQFINSYSGLSDVAIYSLAARIGMLINPVFIDPMRRVFTPVKFKVYNRENGKDIISSYYKIYCFLGGLILLGMSIYSKWAIEILANTEYMGALYIIPIIGISYFFWGLNEFYAIGIIIGNKSFLNSGIAFLSALLNVIVNIYLIPKIGMYGAALSSIIAYFITNELYYNFGKKYYKINLNRLEWIKFLSIYLCLYYVYIVTSLKINIWIELITNVFFLIGYVLLNVLFKFIKFDELKELKISNDI